MDSITGKEFTWVQGTTLEALREEAEASPPQYSEDKKRKSWQERLLEDSDDDACLICTL